ncbi:chitin biosynthesis protein [Apiospora arundinis]|uniref:Chitin biosynthesis protein n=1 Tax=Apiospora arundinis TaxID=335852 RepID=A0ABR2J8Y6_9PEZI
MLVSLTVGKVDAGVTVLLTPDKRLSFVFMHCHHGPNPSSFWSQAVANTLRQWPGLHILPIDAACLPGLFGLTRTNHQIEFPSILLPPNIASGSIVDITVARNHGSESEADKKFAALQDQIYGAFGAGEPSVPVLRCRNATQTSVVLEWDPIELATADLISLSLYRNGQKAGNIPRPLHMHSTKISGLAVDTEYTFHLVLRTSAGTFSSKQVAVSTHKMTDLSGITITTGIMPGTTRDALGTAVERIGAKIVDGVRIDTTHFVTTEGRGMAWEKAVEMNIPVVRPEWVEACEKQGRILGVTKFYLDALRPGPPSDEVSRADSTAPQSGSSPQKDLPPSPPKEDESETTAAAEPKSRKEESSSESENNDHDDSDSDEENEDKARANESEQKVRLEDKNSQKVALRPGQSSSQGHWGGSEDGADDKQPAPSPGDGASFQDVAL